MWKKVIFLITMIIRVSAKENVEAGFKSAASNSSCKCDSKYDSTDKVYSSGTVSSPKDAKGLYCSNMNCVYHINVPKGNHVVFRFTDFHMEADLDYVDIYDGAEIEKHTHMGRYTGTTYPRRDFSVGSEHMTLVFVSDEYANYPGFIGRFHGSNESFCSPVRSDERSGQIMTPNFGVMKYPLNFHCVWDIAIPVGRKMVYKVDNKSQTELGKDKVTVTRYGYWQGVEDVLSSTVTHSGAGTYFFNSISDIRIRHLQISFSSDKYTAGYGFKLEWKLSEVNWNGCIEKKGAKRNFCSESVRQRMQYPVWLAFPCLPDEYVKLEAPENKRYIFTFAAEPGNRVLMQMKYFDLESAFGKIEIYDGDNITTATLLQTCSYRTCYDVKSRKTNYLTVSTMPYYSPWRHYDARRRFDLLFTEIKKKH